MKTRLTPTTARTSPILDDERQIFVKNGIVQYRGAFEALAIAQLFKDTGLRHFFGLGGPW